MPHFQKSPDSWGRVAFGARALVGWWLVPICGGASRAWYKHQRAVLLHLAAIEGMEGADEAPQSARRPTCGVCTQELAPGILAGVCADCVEAGLLFDGVAAIKAAFGADAGAVVRTIVA